MANTKIPSELSSTPSISDSGNATAITIDSSENVALSNDLTVDGATLVVDASENKVGINRSTPTAPLDVSGEAKISGDLTSGSYKVGDPSNESENFGTVANNTISTAYSDINSNITNTGVYWLNFNSKKFRAFVRPNWMQGRNWVLAAKFYNHNDMTSGNTLWTNDTSHNEGDFDIYSGNWSKYGQVWRYFSFNRLAMQMGDRVAPIMQFNSNQTLYAAFSGGRAANGSGVTADSTDPQIANSATYHGMSPYMGGAFTNLSGSEDVMQSYGLNKWARNASNSTSSNNQSSYNKTGTVKGHQLTIEDSHPNNSVLSSQGVAGAWIGCPLDEGGFTFGTDASNAGADSGFGFGAGAGNNARTWTSGVAEWGRGNEVANYLPAYIWLSID